MLRRTPALETLSLSSNRLGDATVEFLVESLLVEEEETFTRLPPPQTPLVRLEALNLAGNALSNSSLAALGAALTAGAMPKLSSVNLACNQLSSLAPLATAAASSPACLDALAAVNVEYNLLTDASLREIIGAVLARHLPRLSSFHAGGNLLTDETLDALGGAVVSGTSELRLLSLELNRFTRPSKLSLEAACEAVAPPVRLRW